MPDALKFALQVLFWIVVVIIIKRVVFRAVTWFINR
jgi:hypothetical protein